MKIYYSKFAYTVMLVCSIIMLIALSAALYVLMFKIPKIEILPKILLSLLLLFAFIFSVGFTVMTIRRLFIVNTAVEFTAVGITIYYGAFNLEKLFISKEEIIRYRELINETDIMYIKQLNVLLRIAKAFDRSMSQVITDMACDVLGDSVIIKTEQKEGADCSIEIKTALTTSNDFKNAFGKGLEIL